MKKPWEAIDRLDKYGDARWESLSEYNARKAAELDEAMLQLHHPEKFLNGLLCECGGGLFDLNTLNQGTPPKIRVKCKSCGKKDWRYP